MTPDNNQTFLQLPDCHKLVMTLFTFNLLMLFVMQSTNANDYYATHSPIPLWASERTPIGEKAVEIINETVLIPPTRKKQGWFFRAGLSSEYTNNLFFSAQNRIDDIRNLLSLGLHVKKIWPKLSLLADLQNDSSLYNKNSDINDESEAQNFLFRLHYQITKKTNLDINYQSRTFKDPGSQIIIGQPTNQLTATRQNYSHAHLTHKQTANFSVNANIIQKTSDYNSQNSINIDSREIIIGTTYNLNAKAQLGLNFRNKNYDFKNNEKIDTNAIYLNHSHLLNRIYSIKTNIGLYQVKNNNDTKNALLELTLNANYKQQKVTLGFTQDLMSSGIGSSDIYESQSITARTRRRFGKNLYGYFSINKSRYINLGNSSNYFKLTTLACGINYNPKGKLFFRSEISTVKEKDQPNTIIKQANKFTISMHTYF